jgi:hypothetical protein
LEKHKHSVWIIIIEDNIPESVEVRFGTLHSHSLNTSLVLVQSSYNNSAKLVHHVKQMNGLQPLHCLPAVLLQISAVQTKKIITRYK